MAPQEEGTPHNLPPLSQSLLEQTQAKKTKMIIAEIARLGTEIVLFVVFFYLLKKFADKYREHPKYGWLLSPTLKRKV